LHGGKMSFVMKRKSCGGIEKSCRKPSISKNLVCAGRALHGALSNYQKKHETRIEFENAR
ncbi:MAG: hypothetical protein ACK6EB_43035, partial [Planctomyces sp.]